MKDIRILVVLFIFSLMLPACGDAIHGSVMGSRLKCTATLNGGRCEGSIRKLKGTISEDMSLARPNFHQVQVEVWASVENGSLRIFLVDPDGVETSQIIRAGSSGSISGIAEGYYDSFRVYFEALEGEVQGIQFLVDYAYP